MGDDAGRVRGPGVERRRDNSITIRAMLRRDRLLATMATRFERTATLISAGAGFGKSTLVAQALDAVPRGTAHAVTHRIHPNDVDGTDLLASLADQIDAVAREVRDDPTPFADDISLADRLWHLSPNHVTVVVDDIHLLPPGALRGPP